MRDLHLTRTIPLVGLGVFVLVGCGGRTIDETGGAGSSAVDPLSDDNFEDSLLDSFEDLCLKQQRCDDYSEFDDASECAEYSLYSIESGFDLDSRDCRRHVLDAIDCLAEDAGCNYSSDVCRSEIDDLIENCADRSNYYYY